MQQRYGKSKMKCVIFITDDLCLQNLKLFPNGARLENRTGRGWSAGVTPARPRARHPAPEFWARRSARHLSACVRAEPRARRSGGEAGAQGREAGRRRRSARAAAGVESKMLGASDAGAEFRIPSGAEQAVEGPGSWLGSAWHRLVAGARPPLAPRGSLSSCPLPRSKVLPALLMPACHLFNNLLLAPHPLQW